VKAYVGKSSPALRSAFAAGLGEYALGDQPSKDRYLIVQDPPANENDGLAFPFRTPRGGEASPRKSGDQGQAAVVIDCFVAGWGLRTGNSFYVVVRTKRERFGLG